MDLFGKVIKKIGWVLLFAVGLIGRMFALLVVVYLVVEFIPDKTHELRNQKNERRYFEEDWENTTDLMWEEYAGRLTMQVFRVGGATYLADTAEEVEVGNSLEDGRFYEIVADVTYLNGGVAGYYNYPQINEVLSYEEISPFDLDLPYITEKRSGLVFIGDYADGDLFFHEYWRHDAYVWKDGEWAWSYNDEMDLDDGMTVFYRSGVTEEEILKGIDDGVLACGDYILLPEIASE